MLGPFWKAVNREGGFFFNVMFDVFLPRVTSNLHQMAVSFSFKSLDSEEDKVIHPEEKKKSMQVSVISSTFLW